MIVAHGVGRPYPSERVSGDAFLVEPTQQGLLVALVDALGHGPIASAVATLAIDTLRAHANEGPAKLIELVHRALLRGRGAAISLVTLDHHGNGLFAGVGNVAARVYPDSTRAPVLLPTAGIVGHQYRRLREVAFRLPLDGVGLLHSDGVSTRIQPLDGPPSSLQRRAESLLTSFARDTDDASLVLFAHQGSPRFQWA